MAKLNQIVAIVTGKKPRTEQAKTTIYHKVQKGELFSGISRTYEPFNEGDDQQPPESKNVQYSVKEAVDAFQKAVADLWDTTFTMDANNCEARADVKVGDKVIVKDVPVTHLLFLEKQLQDLRTFITKLPVLDRAENWSWSDTANCFASQPTLNNRTKKVPRTHVKYEATSEHPAQCEVYHEDVAVGRWTSIKFSGAMEARRKELWLENLEKLIEGVKSAREEANEMEVTRRELADNVFKFVFV